MPILFPAVVEDLVNWLMFNATIVVNTGIFQRIADSEQMLHVNRNIMNRIHGIMGIMNTMMGNSIMIKGENFTGSQGENLIQDSNQGYGSIDQTPVGDGNNYLGYVCMVREISPTHSTKFQATKSHGYTIQECNVNVFAVWARLTHLK